MTSPNGSRFERAPVPRFEFRIVSVNCGALGIVFDCAERHPSGADIVMLRAERLELSASSPLRGDRMIHSTSELPQSIELPQLAAVPIVKVNLT